MSDELGDSESPTQWEARQARLIKKTVRECLVEFGFEPEEPTAMQQDMAHLRRHRLASESIGVKAIATLVGALITGGLGFLVVAIREYLNR